MGTPGYVAPEQVKRCRGDQRTDIYALGVIVYEMLTGQTPFTGINPLVVLNGRVVNEPIPPREANPELSPGLEAVLLRALARNLANRYAAAGEFAAGLRAPDRTAERHAAAPAPATRRKVLFYSGLAMPAAGKRGFRLRSLAVEAVCP
jgi:serine/threonine protein kinase